jgi:hypothetical protein
VKKIFPSATFELYMARFAENGTKIKFDTVLDTRSRAAA